MLAVCQGAAPRHLSNMPDGEGKANSCIESHRIQGKSGLAKAFFHSPGYCRQPDNPTHAMPCYAMLTDPPHQTPSESHAALLGEGK